MSCEFCLRVCPPHQVHGTRGGRAAEPPVPVGQLPALQDGLQGGCLGSVGRAAQVLRSGSVRTVCLAIASSWGVKMPRLLPVRTAGLDGAGCGWGGLTPGGMLPVVASWQCKGRFGLAPPHPVYCLSL